MTQLTWHTEKRKVDDLVPHARKSTIMTLSLPIWAVLGAPQKKFVLILTKTQAQAKVHFANLKRELEGNTLLKADLGPFQDDSAEWGQYSTVLTKYGARITAASSEQSIRGLRHGEHRPDLIIVDDPEDLQSVKTLEGRDKTYQWLTGEVIPGGDKGTKIIVVGNLLHEDSVMMRLKDGIEKGILNADHHCALRKGTSPKKAAVLTITFITDAREAKTKPANRDISKRKPSWRNSSKS